MNIKFPINICSKPFFHEDLNTIHQILKDNPKETRSGLARIICQRFNWFSPNGRLKHMSCKAAMLKLHRKGLIKLPPPTKRGYNANKNIHIQITSISDPAPPITKTPSQLASLSINQVKSPKESQLWNQFIHRYHYLGYKPLPGAQIRYLIQCKDGFIGAISFSASAWKVAPRDKWIGWTDSQREKNLHLIVNNSRLLILPWVRSKNLASKILSLCAKQLPSDWLVRYGYQPVLLETFVEKNRFKGTCYRAANWILVDQTQGRGKKDRYNLCQLPIKDIWLYPLKSNFREELCN
jgi:hypothetical protein